MNVLLDTHIFLWAAGIGTRLSESTLSFLRDPSQRLFFSAASAWEIAIKYSKGKLELPGRPAQIVENVIRTGGFSRLPISIGDALAVAELPFHHMDPFDRLLVAQARRHDLKLMTADSTMERYDVDVIALWGEDDE